MGKDVTITFGAGIPLAAATKDDPFNFEFTTPPAMAGGAPVANMVSITDLAARGAKETLTDASKRKADTMAAAINAVLPKVGGQPAATVTQKKTGFREIVDFKPPILDANGKVIVKAAPIYAPVMQSYVTVAGLYSVPPTPGAPGTPGLKQLTNPTQETGDGVRIGAGKPGAAPTPTPSTGSMGSTGMSAPASGMSAGGAQSFVYFGVEEVAMGAVLPYAGETETQILQSIGSQLDQTGVQTSFDSLNDTLTIPFIPAGDTLVWGNTDSNLDFAIAFGVALPEPGAWVLMLCGLGLLGGCLRRRPVGPTSPGKTWAARGAREAGG